MKIKEIMANYTYKGKETGQNIEKAFDNIHECPQEFYVLKDCYRGNCRDCYESENKG